MPFNALLNFAWQHARTLGQAEFVTITSAWEITACQQSIVVVIYFRFHLRQKNDSETHITLWSQALEGHFRQPLYDYVCSNLKPLRMSFFFPPVIPELKMLQTAQIVPGRTQLSIFLRIPVVFIHCRKLKS